MPLALAQQTGDRTSLHRTFGKAVPRRTPGIYPVQCLESFEVQAFVDRLHGNEAVDGPILLSLVTGPDE